WWLVLGKASWFYSAKPGELHLHGVLRLSVLWDARRALLRINAAGQVLARSRQAGNEALRRYGPGRPYTKIFMDLEDATHAIVAVPGAQSKRRGASRLGNP